MKNKKDGRVSHGMYGTRIYRIWNAMKNRCTNENYPEFNLYGGRGIYIFGEWKKFESFYKWSLISGYEDQLTIERTDTNGSYSPENCSWATPKQQANNRRSNIIINYKGVSKNIKEWSETLGIAYKPLWSRLNKGWSAERAFNTPLKDVQTS